MAKDSISLKITDLNEDFKEVLEITVDLNKSSCVSFDDDLNIMQLYLSKETALKLADFILKNYKKEENL